MHKFNRRIYHGLSELVSDFRAVFSKRKQIRPLMNGEMIEPAFLERLMLAVTAVNRCRYCSYAHTREALEKGISQEEINALDRGLFTESPEEEVTALLYAQHWAEVDGNPEESLRERMIAQYGEQEFEAMELAMQMIRVGNLLGNSFDYFLYRISFGQWSART